MQSTRCYTNRDEEFSFFTRVLADFCHDCGMCRRASRGPRSVFDHFMDRYRNWCPPWAAFSRVYGDEPSEYDEYDNAPYSRSESDSYDDWD